MFDREKGHYAVRDQVLDLTHLADPSAEVEVTGLFSDAPTLRPADIFTIAALPGRSAALDIGICSPDACTAGLDCCDSMRRKKVDKYAHYVGRVDFEYRPLVFSWYGRVHPECQDILKTLARGAARRRGVRDYGTLLSRVHQNIGVEIWRRLALMVHACLPKLSDTEEQLLNGGPFEIDSGNPYPGSGRLNTLAPTLVSGGRGE